MIIQRSEGNRSRESLRGLEGQAVAAYFRAYSSMFRRSLGFPKRSRRPPQDPVNAALSLGYALLFGEALAVIAPVGFDPYLGFLHAPEYGRCSLALDLMEEFRAAIVDRLALTLFRREIIINATGGFKAEIAYATLVGLLFDTPVFYIHEAFRDIIEMPPTPIGWDYSLLADYEEFFAWLSKELRSTGEVDERLRGLPSKIRLLLTEEEGCTFLSPAGEAFYESYQDRLQQQAARVRILLSSAAQQTFNSAEPNVQQLFRRALEKLRLLELRISHSDRVNNSDCLVFPKGHRDERLFYFEDHDGSLRVCELARHSDQSYERLIEGGVFRKNYSDFAVLE